MRCYLTLVAWLATVAVGLNVPNTAHGQIMRIRDDTARDRLTITIGPIDLPGATHGGGHGHTGAVSPRPVVLEVPANVSIHGFEFTLTDATGRVLTPRILHHLNVVDPDHRELFLPIARRVLAVGQDTPPASLPSFLFGYPLRAGDRLAVSVTLHNPTGDDLRGVTVELHLPYVPAGRPWPLFDLVPFHIDVGFPAVDPTFDIPPGRSTHSWEGSPAAPGRVVAVGSHLHDYGTRITFEDVTAGRVIWEGAPRTHADGRVDRSPVGPLYRRFGVRVLPERVYRVTVTYENPTDTTIPAGGMGVLGGVFVPGTVAALDADPDDPLYRRDWANYMQHDRASADSATRRNHPHR